MAGSWRLRWDDFKNQYNYVHPARKQQLDKILEWRKTLDWTVPQLKEFALTAIGVAEASQATDEQLRTLNELLNGEYYKLGDNQ